MAKEGWDWPYSLANAGILGLRPYQPGKSSAVVEKELGIRGAVKMASNESLLGAPRGARRAYLRALKELRRYPDSEGWVLREALAAHWRVAAEQITLGNGSNEVLELLGRVFLAPGSSALYARHAFIVYPLLVQGCGAQEVVVPTRSWEYDLEAMAAALRADTRLVFLANPNNPTGSWITEEQLRGFLDRVPAQVLVVLDEAYLEYVRDPRYPDSLALMKEHPNLVLTRTFSKIYGLAGLRVGYAISTPAVAELLQRARAPFNVNTPALEAAAAALEDTRHVARVQALTRAGMEQLQEGLAALSLPWIPSQGNFLSVEFPSARSMYQALLRRGVILRPLEVYEMPHHLRVTVGLPRENRRFLRALAAIRQEQGGAWPR